MRALSDTTKLAAQQLIQNFAGIGDAEPRYLQSGTPMNVLTKHKPVPGYPMVLQENYRPHITREGRQVVAESATAINRRGKREYDVMVHRGVPLSVAKAVENDLRRHHSGKTVNKPRASVPGGLRRRMLNLSLDG